MDASAPRIDYTGANPPFGYHQFHRDAGLNFECNRWAESIGPEACEGVAELAGRATTYPEWIDGYLGARRTGPRRGPHLHGGLVRPGGRLLHDRRRPASPGRPEPIPGHHAVHL